MEAEKPAEKPQIAEDPNFAAEQAKAQRTLIDSLQTQAQMDTANIMARYGSRVALANAGLTTVAATPQTSPLVGTIR
jgi:hypothetical protein